MPRVLTIPKIMEEANMLIRVGDNFYPEDKIIAVRKEPAAEGEEWQVIVEHKVFPYNSRTDCVYKGTVDEVNAVLNDVEEQQKRLYS